MISKHFSSHLWNLCIAVFASYHGYSLVWSPFDTDMPGYDLLIFLFFFSITSPACLLGYENLAHGVFILFYILAISLGVYMLFLGWAFSSRMDISS